jgi:ribosomal protein S18 acetylase RimI-like enzyme
MAESFFIRLATEDDLDTIRGIDLRAWSGGITTHELLEQRHGLIDGCPWAERIADAAATHLAGPDVTTFVAELAPSTGSGQVGRVVGYAAAEIKREDPVSEIGIVSYNAVDPAYQGRGIGTALMEQVTRYLKEQGARVLAVWTLEVDAPARHIYEKLGFKELTRFVYYTRDA